MRSCCRHIIACLREEGKPLFDPSYFAPRWKKVTEVDEEDPEVSRSAEEGGGGDDDDDDLFAVNENEQDLDQPTYLSPISTKKAK